MAFSSRTQRLVFASLVTLSGCPEAAQIVAGVGDAASSTDAAVTTDAAWSSDARVDAPDAAPAMEAFEVIGERSVTLLETPRRVELIRGTRRDGAHTYLLYIHAPAANAPVVIVNEPYAGINWSGEAVDARWAALGDGLHPDIDAPAYDGNDVISYGAQTVETAVNESLVWLYNGAAVVHVYGRFYTGGTLLDDAEDAAMGYAFVASRSREVDVARIGGYGGSWGGMMTLFGAALARDAHARSLSALAPPSNFIDLYQHSEVEMPMRFGNPTQSEAFFSPYWRRSTPSVGFPPSATDPRALAFSPQGLCAALPSDVLVLHDDWDLLIPVRQTEALTTACAGKVEPLLWRRGALDYATTPLDHGPFNAEGNVPSVLTFSALHLLHGILPTTSPVTALGSTASLRIYLQLVRDARAAGEDVTWSLRPLRQLADARTQLYDPDAVALTPGAEALAAAFNPVFGTSLDAAGLRAQLALGLP